MKPRSVLENREISCRKKLPFLICYEIYQVACAFFQIFHFWNSRPIIWDNLFAFFDDVKADNWLRLTVRIWFGLRANPPSRLHTHRTLTKMAIKKRAIDI